MSLEKITVYEIVKIREVGFGRGDRARGRGSGRVCRGPIRLVGSDWGRSERIGEMGEGSGGCGKDRGTYFASKHLPDNKLIR